MSLNTDITRSRSQHAEQNSQKPSWGPDSVPSQGRPASHPSSDSASTSTTVTTSENSNRTTAKLPDYGIISGARPLIVRRRSRPKLEGQRSSRSDRELSSREAVRKTTDGSCGGLARREKTPDIAVADQSRRDKGKAVIRSAHTPSTRRPLPESPMFSSSDNSSFSGQPASAEFERLKEEIDLWKKAATDNKKQAKKHAMKVEELKTQISAETSAKEEQEKQVQTVKGKIEKKEELITTIEKSLQCLICMDLIHLPYALSPCGHILCLSCLQEWFRKTRHRGKSCPCCRAVITQRPIPVFIVKDITAALHNHRATVEPGMSIRNESPSPNSEDPWKDLFDSTGDDSHGIGGFEASEEDERLRALQAGFPGEFGHQLPEAFEGVERQRGNEFEVGEGPEIGNEQGTYEYGDGEGVNSYELSEYGDAEGVNSYESSEYSDGEDVSDVSPFESSEYGDGEGVNSYESEEYENVYIPARWEPPSVVVDPEMYVFRNQVVEASILRILRRGCTVDMIRLFEITYSHDQGLVAHLPSLYDDLSWLSHTDIGLIRSNRVFLGWNVYLDREDYTGELYMRCLLNDIRANPETWLWTESAYSPAAFDVKLLVRIEEVDDYDTTDTEDWLARDLYD